MKEKFFLIIKKRGFKPARAAGIIPCKGADCTLNDFGVLAINIAGWILGIVGSLSLLMFVYGGVLLLMSGGNTETVGKGKQALTNAVIGLIIVLMSYMIIGFVFKATGADATGAWSKINWFSNSP